jgi:hypothetical protein
MTFGNAVLAAFVAANGVIDKLELETIIPKTQRTFLATYQAKGAAKSTTKTEDIRMLNILKQWMILRHKITA